MAERVHELKTWPEFFEALLDGSKTFEVRKNDRGFCVGDLLELHEWRPALVGGDYTGRLLLYRVTYILEGGFGLESGYVVMGIKPETANG